MGKRRPSHQCSELDLEDQILEWANMTWFLLTLGGVCLQHLPKLQKLIAQIKSANTGSLMHHSASSSLSLNCTGSGRSSLNCSGGASSSAPNAGTSSGAVPDVPKHPVAQ